MSQHLPTTTVHPFSLHDAIPISLPDGEIKAGTPTPAIVPMPTLPMAPMPSAVFVQNGQIVFGTPAAPDPTGANVTANPGFPFLDRKSTRLNSSHSQILYAVFRL